MADVVSRLLAAIDERQRKAEAAARLQWDSEEGWGRDGHTLIPHIGVIHEDQPFEHILANDPPSVLRLCQAHRDIVATYEQQRQMAAQLEEVDFEAYLTASGVVAGMKAAIALVARGYGVEDGED